MTYDAAMWRRCDALEAVVEEIERMSATKSYPPSTITRYEERQRWRSRDQSSVRPYDIDVKARGALATGKSRKEVARLGRPGPARPPGESGGVSQKERNWAHEGRGRGAHREVEQNP